MRVRGWLLARVLIASVAIIAAWLLGIIPAIQQSWHASTLYVALAIVFILYVTSEYLHAVAGRKETPAYRDHIANLQGFARAARERVEMRQQSMLVAIDLSEPLGSAFTAHFNIAVVRLEQWNRLASGWDRVIAAFATSFSAETARLGLVNSGFPSVLQGSVLGWIKVGQLTWFAQTGKVHVSADSTWEIAQLPETEKETERLLTSLWESLTNVRDIPEVAEWARRMRESAELWRPLRDELGTIEFNHDPAGHCKLCPR
jgi:hypothetical protein